LNVCLESFSKTWRRKSDSWL